MLGIRKKLGKNRPLRAGDPIEQGDEESLRIVATYNHAIDLGEPACEAAAAVAKQINTGDQVGSFDDSSSESTKGGGGGSFSDDLSYDPKTTDFESMLGNLTSEDEKCGSDDSSVWTMELSNYDGSVSVRSIEYEVESEPEPESELPKKRLTRRDQPELRPPAHRSSSPSPPPVDGRVAVRLAAENADKEARIAKPEAQLARWTEEPTTNAATQRRVTAPQQPHPVARGEEIEARLGAIQSNHDPNETGKVHMIYMSSLFSSNKTKYDTSAADQVDSFDDRSPKSTKGGGGGSFSNDPSYDPKTTHFEFMLGNLISKDEKCGSDDGSSYVSAAPSKDEEVGTDEENATVPLVHGRSTKSLSKRPFGTSAAETAQQFEENTKKFEKLTRQVEEDRKRMAAGCELTKDEERMLREVLALKLGFNQNDPRFVETCILYAEKTSDPSSVFKLMSKIKVGRKVSLFWVAWAWCAEQAGDIPFTEKIFEKALSVGIKPQKMLLDWKEDFVKRMNASQAQEDRAGLEEEEGLGRGPLNSLSSVGSRNDRRFGRALLLPNGASRHSARSRPPQGRRDNKPTCGFNICQEDDIPHGARGVLDDDENAPGTRLRLVRESERNKENVRPEQWNERECGLPAAMGACSIVSRVQDSSRHYGTGSAAGFDVFVDEEFNKDENDAKDAATANHD